MAYWTTGDTITATKLNNGVVSTFVKEASTTVRNSHDAVVIVPYLSSTLLKKFTLNEYMTGIITIYFEIQSPDETLTTYGRIHKNGAAIGTLQSIASTTWTAFSENFSVNMLRGETLELWGYANSTQSGHNARNFQLQYSNSAEVVTNPTIIVNTTIS